ncbi:MAG: hypothetical protein ACHQHN_08205 [Sphingobacteriales bacterium]
MKKDGLGVQTTVPANPSTVAEGYVPNLTSHVHPKGSIFDVTTGKGESYQQSASNADIRHDGKRSGSITRNYVLGAGDKTVRIYDHSGNQVATFPLNTFIFTKP